MIYKPIKEEREWKTETKNSKKQALISKTEITTDKPVKDEDNDFKKRLRLANANSDSEVSSQESQNSA